MVHTAIGIFPTHNHAENAVAQLAANGFDRQYINVTSRSKMTEGSEFFDEDDNPTYQEQLRKYFRNIFNEEEDIESYSRAAYSGVLVTIQTDNYGQASRAAEIMDKCGTIYIESKAHALQHGYNEHDRLNTVNDEDDREISDGTRVNNSSSNESGFADRDYKKQNLKVRRTYIVDTPLNGDFGNVEEHIRIETIPADKPMPDSHTESK